MRAQLRWTPQAQQDLVELYTYLRQQNEAFAERVFHSIQRRAELLSRFPRLGKRSPHVSPTARILVHGNYLLLYETVPDSDVEPIVQINLVRVVDGRRDLHRM